MSIKGNNDGRFFPRIYDMFSLDFGPDSGVR